MATQWYIRRGSKISSPRDSAQLKSDATTGFVKPTDEVSQSPTGPWTVAQKVKGLFPSVGASEIRDEPAGQESSSVKPCPFCAEKIQVAAIKCKHCGEKLINQLPNLANNNVKVEVKDSLLVWAVAVIGFVLTTIAIIWICRDRGIL